MPIRFPRFYWYEWMLIICTITVIIFLLTGCERTAVPLHNGDTPSFLSGGPSGILTKLALVATALAGTVLIACAFVAIVFKGFLGAERLARIAGGCLAVIAISQMVYWLGNHLWILVCGTIAIAGLWAWAHVRLIEKWFGTDLNNDKKIG